MNETRCIFCGDTVPEGRMVCPNCERKAVAGKLSRAELRRIQKQTEKKSRVYTVTDAQLKKMVKTTALEMLEKGIKEYRDNEIGMLREDIRKIHSLNLAVYRNVLFDMGLLNRENTEEFVTRTNAAWAEIDRLIGNGNMHELQKFASLLGADDDTFLNVLQHDKTPREAAELIIDIQEDDS